MRPMRPVLALARLEFGDVLRSRWLLLCGALYALFALVFVFVAMRESTVLGFTGMNRVLISFSHALLLVLPLLALLATGQVVNQARANGAFELLFSHPFPRSSYYVATTLVRYALLLLPFVVLLAAMEAYAHRAYGEPVAWRFLGTATAVAAALLWSFVGIGLAISTFVRNPTRALTYCLVAYAAAVALLDFALIAMMLRWRLAPQGVFLLAALNPVEAARVALLSSAQPDLSVLGTVGFYLATRWGPAKLFALGVAWPVVVGTITWVAGLQRFRHGDLV